MGAGVETVSWTLAVTSFHLLNNSRILHKLQAELEKEFPDPTATLHSLQQEKLSYLSACIQEGIRLSYGVSSRNPRISPDAPIKYNIWTIPAGTPVSMTTLDTNHDEHIFPKSHEFILERWLDNPVTKDGHNLDHYAVTFGKGARSCLGIK